MCQPCDMYAPIPDDTGQEAVVFPSTSWGMRSEEPIQRSWHIKKPANSLRQRAFGLVAGTGFEPVTFRL